MELRKVIEDIAEEKVIEDIAEELVAIDKSGVSFKSFQPGVGPYGEPQLIREIAKRLNVRNEYAGKTGS